MNYQEIEEMNYYPQSESQMCYEEAGQFMRAIEPVVYGVGEFTLKVIDSHFCRATDAYVGRYVSSIHHFEDILEFSDFVRDFYSDYTGEQDIEIG